MRYGGALDTVLEGATGALLKEVSPEAVRGAIRAVVALPPPRAALVAHAAGFSKAGFAARLREIVSGG